MLPPLLALLIAWRKGERLSVFKLAEYLGYLAVLFVICMLSMIPAERIAVRQNYGTGRLFIDYGAVALAVSMGLGAALGLASRLIKARNTFVCTVEPIRPEERRIGISTVLGHLAVLALSILTCAYRWGLRNYGNVTFDEMLFHINMPLEGTAESFIRDVEIKVLLAGVLLALVILAALHIPAKKGWWIRRAGSRRVWVRFFPLKLPRTASALALAAWMCILLVCADKSFTITDFVRKQLSQSHFIENEYVDAGAVQLTFPEEKRNLITVYLESAETSSQDVANGGFFEVNYIPEMTEIAKANVSFSQSDLLEGAAVAPACGWTIAGLVAETAGLPLKLYAYEDKTDGADNAMEYATTFLPGATMLGDILQQAGYRNVFLAGSDFTFGGRRLMYTQHGDYEIRDYLYAKEKNLIPADSENTFWGYQDEVLYALARDTLTELAASSEPFHLALLTVDTHAPDGDVCPLCPDLYADRIANVIACSSAQLGDFIAWCQEQPFYANTTIAVMGDHASMIAGFYKEEENGKHAGTSKRKVYNAFINSAAEPVREKNRLFTTLDLFPTTLASLGVRIEGERLGLGTNLFSAEETLAEKYGYEVLFDELYRKSVFYDENILYP
ncbi:MAG: LTA synthase family protein [Candidatus Ventricola sp.]